MADSLYLVRLRLDLPTLLRRGTVGRQRTVDLGYLVHCALGDLFGDLAPHPFRILEETGKHLEILGYSSRDDEALRRLNSESAASRALDWNHLAAKPLPTEWPVGHRLAFEVRVCPVVRRRQGGETDAFLARCLDEGPAGARLSRESIYRDWLRRRSEMAAVALSDIRLERFQRQRFLRLRQDAARSVSRPERPDATLAGELEIQEPAAFRRLLRRGVGRHRAFGFGMLLLRPAGRR
jgi:CRISPR system Cascade subunit CasE